MVTGNIKNVKLIVFLKGETKLFVHRVISSTWLQSGIDARVIVSHLASAWSRWLPSSML